MPPSGLSAEASPAPSQTPLASSTDDPGAVLSIFAPPPPSEALPEALQEVIGPRPAADGDVLMRDAAEGFESRLRPTRGGDVGVRTGVSASGKGVKVGGAIKLGPTQGKKKRTRGEPEVPNQDFCSACRGIGRFLCCDGCPRSFHFMCLEPPLRIDELPDEEVWYCKKCRQERVLGTGSRGEYVDTEETRTKYDRKGFQEERDGTRLRDGKARPVACYACGGSSIPLRSLTTDPEASWRQIVSCDHCALHWHLDCLNPPLASMPNSGRKWMCPNHAEQVMPRRRTVRSGLETVDVEDRGAANNGNIVVIPDEEPRPRLAYEDMVINKRKYRVPERIIRLDFWDKIGLGKGKAKAPGVNGTSGGRRASGDSELTSLDLEVAEASQEEIAAAELMLSLFNGPTTASLAAGGTSPSDKLAGGIRAEGGGLEGSAVGSSESEVGVVAGASAGAGAASGTPKIMLRMTRQNGL
ncbi:hypothetical protein JCM24511_08593 [Saitozyma sp. JCM 24511]|nr:hypothetical protein JCM24511_08593 [Saitozyma sp. JCM 24511]